MREDYRIVDELYDGFCQRAPIGLRTPLQRLAHTLGLVPSTDVGWSEVFNHEVTLAAPLVLSDAMPNVEQGIVRDATLAHLLAVIEAFGTDRIEDSQVEGTATLRGALGQVRAERDEALSRVAGGAGGPYAEAEAETLAAIRLEREVLSSQSSVSIAEYERVSTGKQAVGMPAALALARVAGWAPNRIAMLDRTLLAIWFALQAHDDVADWQQDAERGGAWAIALAQHKSAGRKMAVDAMVHGSGVLADMLRLSRRRYRAAGTRAAALGAASLARWCREREQEVGLLAQLEGRHPGYVIRFRALSALEHEVLQ